MRRFASNEGIKEGYTEHPKKSLFCRYYLVQRENRERLQVDTDLLLIITSTANELSGGINIEDLKRP